MSSKRRIRSNLARSKSPEQPRHQGVYANQNFTTHAAALIGCNVQVDTTDGKFYTGVYSSFSSHFEVALEFAQLYVNGTEVTKNEPIRRVIINFKNIISMTFKNVDPKFATGDGTFQTDSCISKFDRNGSIATAERDLQPWISECNGDEIDMSLGSEPGWDAAAMFKKNEEMYGVRSSFDHSLSGYTTAIERSDSKGFKEAEARAARIASEIERSAKSLAHAELENGDEEERFAAVIRPNDDRNSPPRMQEKGNKYIPPIRRQGGGGKLAPRSAHFPPGHVSSAPAANDEQHQDKSERRSDGENNSPATQVPTNVSDDNRNNNSCSPSAAPASTPPTSTLPPPTHGRSNIGSNNNNNNNVRGKPYAMQPSYSFVQPPRYVTPPTVQHRPMPPTSQQPPAIQHGPPPPPPGQPISPAVYTQQIPPNHVHHNSLPAGMPQEVPQQALPVQAAPNHQNVNIVHPMDGVTHVHMPPHGVQHAHHVSIPAGYVPAPRDHDPELRGHRNAGIRGPAPRVFQPNNKRFGTPTFQAPPPPRGKTRVEEVNDLAEFSSNLKLATSEPEPEAEEKQDSPPIEQWNKGRSPPSNSSAEDAAKKSTLNPNAKEFVYNPSAKPFQPRPPTTPGQSRPHTPHTPAQQQQFGYPAASVPHVIMPGTLIMQPAFTHQGTPPRMHMTPRPDISSSQMQVAAATGQPLLTPAPLQRYVAPYHNPPPQPYQPMVRMVPGQGPVVFHEGGPHVQYVSPHGQPHPASQFQQTHPQQFPVVYPMPLTQTMIQYFQQPPQPGQQSHVQVIVPNQ